MRRCLILFLALILMPGAVHAAPAELRRFAIIIGANDGGPERVKLRYAGSDAAAIAEVLRELGGVARADSWLLTDPTPETINRTFAEAQVKILKARQAGQRVELLVYYSGHSDESGLLLAGERYGYRDLRVILDQMPSDVKIAVLDSCASGAFTRTKGGARRQPFLVDESANVHGYAFLSSSSADESAQESDRIAASFFTHFFVSGLRGAADANRDGKITLSEAYRFAFDETVQGTESTQAGPQHPAYDMHLAGTGDVVMTDLRATSATLTLAPGVSGRVFVRDGQNHLVVELSKSAGRPVTLALGAGTYAVRWIDGRMLGRAAVTLKRGQGQRLTRASFEAVSRETTVARGEAKPVQRTLVPFQFTVINMTPPDPGQVAYVSLNLLFGWGASVDGLEVGSLYNIDDKNVRGLQIGGLGSWVKGDVAGIQVGGVGNLVGGDLRGVQVGGTVNVVRGPGRGLQVGGVGNANQSSFAGLQLGGVANVNDAFEGVQVGGVANINRDSTRGLQIGLVNIGGSVTGAQVGLINVATHAKGLQLGLLNIAEEHDGAPIGLLNLVRDGRHALEMWTSDTGYFHLGTKLGSKRVYGLLAAAIAQDQWHFGAGLGVHFPLGRDRGYLDLDAVAYDPFERDFDDAENAMVSKLRLAYGFRVAPRIAAFAGIAGSFSFAVDGKGTNPSYFGAKTFENGGNTYRVSPGFFAGLSF